MDFRAIVKAARRIGSLLLILAAPAVQAIDEDPGLAWERLLNEARLHIEAPQNFSAAPIEANSILPYEHALRHESDVIEMRFIIRPLGRITIDYSDPHNAAPEPEHLFPLLFESLANQLSIDSDIPSSTFPEAIAESSFNANWAAAAAFDVDPRFADGYQSALLLAMHRNRVADAYTLFLYNDHEQAKPLINDLLSVMSFAPVEQ